MMIAGGTIGGQALGSIMPGASNVGDSWPGKPIDVIINNVSRRHEALAGSLRITDTLGQPVAMRVTIVNPTTAPVVGDQIRVVWYSEVIFSGTVRRRRQRVNNTRTAKYYELDCVDHTWILVRRKLRRNFSNVGLVGIVDSLLDNELSGEGLSMGKLDLGTLLPLVDADGASVLDTLREAAAATGQVMYVGYDKTINFVSTTNPAFPVDLALTNVETAELIDDLDSYRNRQTVIVKGTPPESSTDALEVSHERENEDQIAERLDIEGGSGVYHEIEEIVHPTSNTQADLQLLAIAYARLRLSTNSVPRSTLRARTRHYGFRAGQVGTASLFSLGVSGEWLIQRVTITEQDGNKLVHELELVRSSLQWRSFLAWLNIVRSGRVTVLPPTTTTSNLQTFNTPGTTTWTVPAGVTTVEFTCVGGSGGAGGGIDGGSSTTYRGGHGGDSGLAIVTINVVEGQVFDITVGAAGSPGANDALPEAPFSTSGTAGTHSQVKLGSAVLCQGNGGGAGEYGSVYDPSGPKVGVDGSPGSGIGDAVTVGGGRQGGTGGIWNHTQNTQPTAGQDGYVEVRW